MKQTTINVQITKTPRPYESVRLGGEWSLGEGEDATQAMAQALEQLNRFYADMMAQAKVEKAKAAETATTAATTGGKMLLVWDRDMRVVNKIVKRIQSGVSLDKVLEYYEPDSSCMNVLKLAAELNEQKAVETVKQ